MRKYRFFEKKFQLFSRVDVSKTAECWVLPRMPREKNYTGNPKMALNPSHCQISTTLNRKQHFNTSLHIPGKFYVYYIESYSISSLKIDSSQNKIKLDTCKVLTRALCWRRVWMGWPPSQLSVTNLSICQLSISIIPFCKDFCQLSVKN